MTKAPTVLAIGVLVATVLVLSNASIATGKTAQSTSSASRHRAVTINTFQFGPKALNVKVGSTVVWTNKDSVAHTVTSDPSSHQKFESGYLNHGKSFRFTFRHVGVFRYHCAIHPFMQGTVRVTSRGS